MLPIVGAMIPGFIGMLTLPYVGYITRGLGNLIENFTTLQPLLMTIFIAVSFALIIVTPLSSVAIAYAISFSRISFGSGKRWDSCNFVYTRHTALLK